MARKCLAQQLEELEIISSIFCGPRELVIDDPGIIVDMHSFIGGQASYLNRKLDYRIQVNLTGLKKRMEVFVELPHYYPALELPTVTVSYPNITTSQHNSLKALVEEALQSLQKSGETFLFTFISWIQDDEKVRKVLLNTDAATGKFLKINPPATASKESKPERLWIYSHHIKSKRKRASIIENARRLQLTGFSLPGKPGIICVEGHQSDTQEFWRIIKAMHWQRIQLRLEETGESIEELATFRRFHKFEEEARFVVANGNADIDNDDDDEDETDNEQNNNKQGEDNGAVLRLNMGTFRAYLEQHHCVDVMASLFGFK